MALLITTGLIIGASVGGIVLMSSAVVGIFVCVRKNPNKNRKHIPHDLPPAHHEMHSIRYSGRYSQSNFGASESEEEGSSVYQPMKKSGSIPAEFNATSTLSCVTTNIQDITITKKLGEGAFGEVFHGMCM